MDYDQYITRDPKICGGAPVLKGTRVTLRTVMASLTEGAGVAEILADFPTLTEEHVRAAIAVAAVSALEDLDDLQYIADHKDEEAIPFETVIAELRDAGRLQE